MADWACSPGFVCLDNGDGVQAYVFVGRKSSKSGQFSSLTIAPPHQTDKGNVSVSWVGRYGKQVREALRSLH